MSKLWKTLNKWGEKIGIVFPFLSIFVHKRVTRPSEDYATGVFSSQQDYKMLYEVSVCFMPASNGKWGLQPSLQSLITAPLSKDKWVCASRSFLKDSCGKMRLHFIYFNNQALHWIVTRLSRSLFSEFELAWPFLLTNKSYVKTASRIHSCGITVREWITHSHDELSWFMCGVV